MVERSVHAIVRSAASRARAIMISLMVSLAASAVATGFAAQDARAQSAESNSGAGIIDNLAGSAKRGRVALPRAPATDIDDVQAAVKSYCEDQGFYGSNVSWTYHPNVTRCVAVRPNMMTSILFPEWEKIIGTNLGDDRGFSVDRQSVRPNVLVVRTNGEMTGADTTLTVFGDAQNGAATTEAAPWGSDQGGRNVYSFILVSLPANSDHLANALLRVRARQPGQGIVTFPDAYGERAATLDVARNAADPRKRRRDDDSMAGDRATSADEPDGRPEWLREIPFDAGKLRFNDYEIRIEEGDDAEDIAPVRVFHDGVFTYLDFGEGDGARGDRNKRPIVLQVIDEIDSRVNVRTTGPTGNIMVIEAIGNFTLKNGRRVVCIVYVGEKPHGNPPGEVG